MKQRSLFKLSAVFSSANLIIQATVILFIFFPGFVLTENAYAGVNKWTTSGPYGGPVRTIAINPSMPSTIFAGIYDGGVFKSTDGGRTWKAKNAGLNSPYVDAIAIDPAMTSTIYAGTSGGLFKSTNDGENWTAINTELHVLDFVINPLTPSTMYASTWEGVFKSTNSGVTWNAVNTGLSNIFVVTLEINPLMPSTIYAGTWGGGVFKSTNGGKSWTDTNIGASGSYVEALAINPLTPSTIYAGTSGGMFKSTNSGKSWTPINAGLTNLEIEAIAIHPSTPSTIYAGTWEGGVFKSTNSGGRWTAMNSGLADFVIQALAIDPSMPSIIYAGTYNQGVFNYKQKSSSLDAKTASSSSIVLSWEDNTDNETGFEIQRKEGTCSSTESWTHIANAYANAATFINNELMPDTPYSYRIRAYNSTGVSSWSNCASAKTALANTPNMPSNLRATSVSIDKIKLTWKDNSTDEKNFKIYRKIDSDLWTLIATATANSEGYTDAAAGNTNSTTYSYKIKACNASGCSPFTNTAIVPYNPINLNTINVTLTQIDLIWEDKSHNETGFQIQRKEGNCTSLNQWSLINTTAENTSAYSSGGLQPNTTYSYRVRSYFRSSSAPYALGYSLWSNCVNATTP